MGEQARALEAWTLATFTVVALGLVGVVAGHVTGVLADALPNLGTGPGVLVFGYLWALTFVGVRWALAEGGLARVHDGEFVALLQRGSLAGAFVGAAFVVGPVVAVGLVSLPAGGLEPLSVLLFAGIGGAVGGLVGTAVGGLFVLVDAGLYRAVVALSSAPVE